MSQEPDIERLDDWEEQLDERRDQEGDTAGIDERVRQVDESETDPEDRPVGRTERVPLPEDERPVYYDEDES